MTPATSIDRVAPRAILLFACGALVLGAFAWQTGIDGCASLVFLLAAIHLGSEHALFALEEIGPGVEPAGARRALLVPLLLLAIYGALLRTDPSLAFQIAFAARGAHHAIGYAHFLSTARRPAGPRRLTLAGAGAIWLLALALSAAERRWDLFFLVDFLGHVLAWGVIGAIGRLRPSVVGAGRHPVRAVGSAALALALTLAFFLLAGGGIDSGAVGASPTGDAGAFAAAWIPHYIIEGYCLWRRW